MGHCELKKATEVNTAAVVSVGLIGGWLTARETGVRPVGGALLVAAGAWAARSWLAKRGPGAALGLSALYAAAFGLSHPLAKKIGAWPAVLAVTGVVAGTVQAVAEGGCCRKER
ncbi:MAG: hypothetical protein Q3997_07845 [Propionibacteriaceae bacterium]|nr:hypothetical protein [Propionibacteriaceae bacterium]